MENDKPTDTTPWRVTMTCCGREAGTRDFSDWADADAFRETYTSGPGVDPHGYSGTGHAGHQRSAVISRA